MNRNPTGSRGSSVGIVTRLHQVSRGVAVRLPVGTGPAMAPTDLPVQWLSGIIFSGVKLPAVRWGEWSCTSYSSTCPYGVHRDKVTFITLSSHTDKCLMCPAYVGRDMQ